jgi:CBS-domain-containing membrane protein
MIRVKTSRRGGCWCFARMQAAQRMRTRKIGSLLVLGADERLVGIVTETDYLQIAERALLGNPLSLRRRPST